MAVVCAAAEQRLRHAERHLRRRDRSAARTLAAPLSWPRKVKQDRIRNSGFDARDLGLGRRPQHSLDVFMHHVRCVVLLPRTA